MALRSVVLALVAIFMSSISILPVNATEDLVIHGTVNIALANQNGMVLLTDSMITAGNHQLPDPGQKLFQLDDDTVCAIAGFVSASGPTPDLNADTSALIHQYAQMSRNQAPQTIEEKLKVLAALFRFHLTAIANLRDATHRQTPIGQYAFQLLIIGYDSDDKPKLGSIILRTDPFFESNIEEVEVVNVNKDLMWRVHGMPDVARNILQHPESRPSDHVIQAYAIAMRKDQGRSLRLDQMVALAKRLAYYTSKVHPEVGGPNQVAILHKPSAVVIDQPSFPVPQKPLFAFQLFVHVGFPPVPVIQMDSRIPSVFVGCRWDGNQNDASALFMRKAVHLDSNYFIGSIFSNVAVAYDGGLFYFDDSNRIVNSTLFIGPDVKRDDKAVQHLVKAFPWLEPH